MLPPLPSLLLLAAPASAGMLLDVVADPGGPYTVTAGESVVLDASGSITVPCSRVEYAWDLDGDGEEDVAGSASPTTVFDAALLDGPENRRISLALTCWALDESGVEGLPSTARASTGLSVENALPQDLEITASPDDLAEGDAVRLSVSFTDPEPADTHTVSWEVERLGTHSGESIEIVLPQDGEIEVQATVRDDDGGEARRTLLLDVANLPPQLWGEPPTATRVGEGYTYAAEVDDPGVQDDLRWSAELPEGAELDSETGEIRWVPTEDQVGAWDLSLTVQDEDGASDRQDWAVTVDSAAPPSEEPRQEGEVTDNQVAPAELEGEGCRCAAAPDRTGGTALLGLLLLPALVRRRSHAGRP